MPAPQQRLDQVEADTLAEQDFRSRALAERADRVHRQPPYAFTWAIADRMFRNDDGVLRVGGRVGIKQTFDPRTYMAKAERSMTARVAQACEDLRAAGTLLAGGPSPLRCSDQGQRRARPRPRHGTGLTFRVLNQNRTSVWRNLLITTSLLAASAVALLGAGVLWGPLPPAFQPFPSWGVVVAGPCRAARTEHCKRQPRERGPGRLPGRPERGRG